MKTVAIPVLLLLVGCPALHAASRPLTPDQAKILASIRASALQYTQKLPDFMCTQITRRQVTSLSTSTSGLTGVVSASGAPATGVANAMHNPAGHGDVIEEQLTFIDHKENYTVLKVDGRKVAGVDHMQFQGAVSAGEFGTDLHNIFDPRSDTVFAWQHPGALHGRRIYIYAFDVPARQGAAVFDRDSGRQVVAAYAGHVFVDAISLDVLRIEYRMDLPLGFPIRDASIMIEYKPIAIAGRTATLPFRSEVRMQDRFRQYDNTIDFRNFHKFAAESKILYGAQGPH